jgi:N4-gp56 family major capsid protein
MAGQLWLTGSLGGYLYSPNLSKKLRVALQPMTKFRQFADVKDATQQGTGRGETFTWNVVSDLVNRGTVVAETSTMPESNFTITQSTLTVTEYGNSVPYTGKLEALSQFDVQRPIMQALRNDAAKTFDVAVFTQFNATPLRVVPTGGTSTTALTLTTNGTATATNNVVFTKDHAKLAVDVMKERNIPAFEGNDYFALGWPSTFRRLRNDLETLHQYTPQGLNMVMNGEVGRYENVRYIEQTNIPKGGAANSGTFNAYTNTADPWDNAQSDWIFFFGEETVAEAIVIPEEMRAKIPTDFGRSRGVAWYYLGGFGLVRTAAAGATIVKWDSAA